MLYWIIAISNLLSMLTYFRSFLIFLSDSETAPARGTAFVLEFLNFVIYVATCDSDQNNQGYRSKHNPSSWLFLCVLWGLLLQNSELDSSYLLGE